MTLIRRTLLSIFALLTLLFMALPTALQLYAPYLAKDQGYDLQVRNIDFNPLTGALAIDGLYLAKQNTPKEAVLQFQHFSAKINPWALFQQRFHLESARLTDGDIRIDKQGEILHIAGLLIAPSQSDQPRDESPSSWTFALDNIELKMWQFDLYANAQTPLTYRLRNLTLNNLSSEQVHTATLQVQSLLEKQPLIAKIELIQWQPELEFQAELITDGFELGRLQPLLETFIPDASVQLNGQLHSDLKLHGKQHSQHWQFTQTGDLSGQNLHITMGEQQFKAQALTWQGQSDTQLNQQLTLETQGQLSAKDLQLKQPEIHLQLAALDSHIAANIQQADTLNIDLKHQIDLQNLNIKQSGQALTLKTWHSDLTQNITLKEQPVVMSDGTVQAKMLRLENDALTLSLQQLDSELNNQLDLAQQSLSHQGSLEVQNLSFKQDQQTLDTNAIHWQGQVTLNDFAADTLKLFSQSELQIKQSHLQQAELNLHNHNIQWLGKVSFNKTDVAALQLQTEGTLDVAQTKLQDSETNAHNQALHWQGKLSLNQNSAQTPMQLTVMGPLTLKQSQFSQADISVELLDILKAKLDTQLTLTDTPSVKDRTQLSLGTLTLQLPEQTVSLQQTQWQGEINLAQNLQAQGDLHTQIQLNQAPWQANTNVAFKLKQLHTDFSTLELLSELTLNQTAMSHPNLSAKLQQLQLFSQAKLNLEEPTQADISGQLNLQQLDAQTQLDSDSSTFSLQQLALNQWQVQQQALSFKQLELANLRLQQPQSAPVLNLEQMRLGRSQLSAESLDIGQIQLNNLASHLAFDAKQTLPIQHHLTHIVAELTGVPIEPQPETDTKPNTQESSETPTLPIKLAGVQISGNNPIVIAMHEPNLRQTLNLKNVTLSALDSTNGQKASDLNLELLIGEFGQFNSKGTLQPFADPRQIQLDNDIQALSLLPYSAIVRDAVGYEINSGQLDASNRFTLNGSDFSADTTLRLNKLQLAAADQSKVAEFDKKITLPLNAALSLLRDKQDNIKLKIPMNGDINNPNIEIADVIAKALSGAMGKASRVYLLSMLQPFGAIALVGEMALDQVKLVRLQAISFDAGSFKLSTQMQEYLQKVSHIMLDKPEFQLQICGGASEQDRRFIATQNKAEIADETLLNLAQQRINKVKQTLIKLKIPAKRLIECRATIRSAEQAPSVEIGF